MILHHLSQLRIRQPMTGHRAWLAPLTTDRRPPVAPKQPELLLERIAK